MSNLFVSNQPRDFFVYVDPNDWLIQHNVGRIGSLCSVPVEPSAPTLIFLPNPDFKTFASPFQNNLVRNYMAEYNLELSRQQYFRTHPCRLHVIFLLDNEEEAQKYAMRHPDHVGRRILKRCKTVGQYCYSVHDSAWINFLRAGGSIDEQTLNFVGQAYWSGDLVVNHQLIMMGKNWSEEPIMEILFLGRVDFYDKTLNTSNKD